MADSIKKRLVCLTGNEPTMGSMCFIHILDWKYVIITMCHLYFHYFERVDPLSSLHTE